MEAETIRSLMALLGLSPANPDTIATELAALAARTATEPAVDDDPTLFQARRT